MGESPTSDPNFNPNPNPNQNQNENLRGQLFYPSDEQLICYYLANKNRINDVVDEGFNFDWIKELNVYNYTPFDLPDNVSYVYGRGGMRRHWYCYTRHGISRDLRRGRRYAVGGYWKRKGGVRLVAGVGRNATVGARTRFVFYLGNSYGRAARTDCVMYEYALVGPHQASFVLCRVFLKPRVEISELVNENTEDRGFCAFNNPTVQRDGYPTPSIVEAEVQIDFSVEEMNDVLQSKGMPMDNQQSTRPIRIGGFLLPSSVQEPVEKSGLTGVNIFVDAETASQLLCFQEEDFIEMDDLID